MAEDYQLEAEAMMVNGSVVPMDFPDVISGGPKKLLRWKSPWKSEVPGV